MELDKKPIDVMVNNAPQLAKEQVNSEQEHEMMMKEIRDVEKKEENSVNVEYIVINNNDNPNSKAAGYVLPGEMQKEQTVLHEECRLGFRIH